VTAKRDLVDMKQSPPPQVGTSVDATILLVTEQVLVLLLPKYGTIGICATKGFNSRYLLSFHLSNIYVGITHSRLSLWDKK
jgi:hypothetical protein